MLNIKRIFSITVLLSVFFMTSIEAQELNKIDANGNRIGAWKKLYSNGKVRYTGQFENGKEVGIFKFYSITSSGSPISTKTYVNGTATVKFYTEFGKLKSQGKMIGKKRVGKWVYYFLNGKPVSQENYKDGKLDGIFKNYYPNGNLTQELHYLKGKKNGISKTFTDSAILIEETLYVNGKLEGKATYYDLKGGIKEEGMYKNGKRVGKWEFYMDGEKVNKKKKMKVSDFKK
ncbi:toxin-antitoxin system YwqK family antitoxin [Tenacibaculum finnmarkense]|uniref:toxin-antitoxin system YwqK family antitoxin n=2 Tax=Tenacibaculum finnmarkense TaxID=2781243 RepID=UPI00187BB4A1|nr:toxin-antitoxin system YwqK family antitoxin [Tenacibaculum finnmarkense]